MVIIVAALIILAVLAAVVGLFAMRDDEARVVTIAETIVQTTPAVTTEATSEPAPTSTSPAPDTTLPPDAIESLLIDYESAYTNQDVAALESLFTADLVRHPGSGPPQDLSEALATYRDQFRELDDPAYQLSDVTVTRGSNEAEAIGNYVITDGERQVGSGRIAFHIVRLDDTLYIDRLEITPSG